MGKLYIKLFLIIEFAHSCIKEEENKYLEILEITGKIKEISDGVDFKKIKM